MTHHYREQAHSYSWIKCIQLEIGRLAGRHRWQASPHIGIGCIQLGIDWGQAAFASRLAPTVLGWVHSVRDWSAVRPPSRAGSLLQLDWVCSAGDWSAVRPPSRAGSLLQLDWVWSVRDWSAGRPPSLASQLPQNQDQKIAACGSSYRKISTTRTRRMPPHSRMSASSAVALDLDLDPQATSEG